MEGEESIRGRARELRTVEALVELTGAGGGALLIRGDAGIGKSLLLECAAGSARLKGYRILRTTGVRTEAHLPFAGLHQLLRPVLGGLDALPGPQRSALAGAFGLVEGASANGFLAALATLTLLVDEAARTPIVTLVDDAQWLDRPSVDALSFVARRLGSDPLSMLITLRDDEPSPFDEAGIDELALEPLGEADARAIVEARTPDLAEAARDRVVTEAAGNPLALVELSISVSADDASGDVLPMGARLERRFADSARGLPEQTSWLLLVAALDDRGETDEILAAAGVSEAALAPAVESRLIEIDAATLRFRHPLIRSAIQQRARPQDRRRAHEALAGAVGDFDRAAWHRAAATDAPDEAVAALLEAAAERAVRRGAFAVAVSALERAAVLSPDGRARGNRLLRAADVATEIGRVDVIGRMLEEAEPIDVPALEERRQAWLTALALAGPPSPREEAQLRSVVAAAARAGEDGEADLGLTLLQFASSRCWWVDPGVQVRSMIASTARRLAPEPGDARAIYIQAIAPEDHIDELLPWLAEHSAPPQAITAVAARRLATAALWLGALDCALDLFALSTAGLRQEGRLGLLARSLVTTSYAAVHLGSLATVASDIDEGVRLSRETRQPFFVATASVAQAIYLAFRGDIAGAEGRMGEVEAVLLDVPASGTLAETRHARGIIDLAAGRSDDAYEQLRHLFELGHASYHATVRGWAVSDFADAAVSSDHLAEARAVLGVVAADEVRMKMPWWRIGVAYARAVLAAGGRNNGEADAAFGAALAMDLQRWPLARARLLLAWGTWLRRQRRIAESRDALRSARDQLDAMGVHYLADRARNELAAGGEASRHRGYDALDQLTPQELQIARLAAEGLSNREIGSRLYLSHRTVGSHLYRAFPKLGVSSRSQLHEALQ